MALLKVCAHPTCNRLVSYGCKYCESHKNTDKEKMRENKANRTDTKEQSFYTSSKWLDLRQVAIHDCYGIDIFKFYTENIIESVEVCHHIIEVKEDWNKRLDINNIICLTEESHQKIHHLYNKSKQDKEYCRQMLIRMKERFMSKYCVW